MAESSIVEMSQFEIKNLNSKLQNKKDLHNYMSTRRKFLFLHCYVITSK